jgi:hypothetical protein
VSTSPFHLGTSTLLYLRHCTYLNSTYPSWTKGYSRWHPDHVLCVGKPTALRSNPPPKQSKSEPKEAIRNYWAQTLLGSGEDGWQAVRTVAGLALHTVRAGFSASARDIETDFSSLVDLPAVPNTIPSASQHLRSVHPLHRSRSYHFAVTRCRPAAFASRSRSVAIASCAPSNLSRHHFGRRVALCIVQLRIISL